MGTAMMNQSRIEEYNQSVNQSQFETIHQIMGTPVVSSHPMLLQNQFGFGLQGTSAANHFNSVHEENPKQILQKPPIKKTKAHKNNLKKIERLPITQMYQYIPNQVYQKIKHNSEIRQERMRRDLASPVQFERPTIDEAQLHMTPTVLNGPYKYEGNPKILTRSRSPRIGAKNERLSEFMHKSFE